MPCFVAILNFKSIDMFFLGFSYKRTIGGVNLDNKKLRKNGKWTDRRTTRSKGNAK